MRRSSLEGAEQRQAFKKIKEYLLTPPCYKLQRQETYSRCTLLHKNGLSELFYYKKKMARSFRWHT
jgi:hypothetical protein